jgi:hypothetical protein
MKPVDSITEIQNIEKDKYIVKQVVRSDDYLHNMYSMNGKFWQEPRDDNNTSIPPCLIKLIYLKQNIRKRADIFYSGIKNIERLLRDYQDSLKKPPSHSDKLTDVAVTDAVNGQLDKTQASGEKGRDGLEPNISTESKISPDESMRDESMAIDERIQEPIKNETSEDLDETQKNLDKLKLDIEAKKAAIKNINDSLSKLEKMGLADESDERQEKMKLYETEQKKLRILVEILRNREKIFKEVKNISETLNKDEIKVGGGSANKEIQQLELELKMKKMMEKEKQRGRKVYTLTKNKEIQKSRDKIKKLELKEKDKYIKLSRKKYIKNDKLVNLLSKRTPRKK